MPDLVSTGIGALTGAASAVAGIINSAKAKKIAKELEISRPRYQISELAGEDLALAESELGNGMSSRAETAYNNLNNQQFSSSLSAILRGGGSVNNVADVYGANEEGRTKLALLNDQIRMQQIDRVMKTRSMYRDEQDKEWQINDFAPWRDKQEANDEARKNAQNQIWSGVGTIANAGMNYFGGRNQEKMYDKYFKSTGGNPGSTNPYLNEASRYNFRNFGGTTDRGENTGRPSVFSTPGINPNQNNDEGFVMPDYLMGENWADAYKMY